MKLYLAVESSSHEYVVALGDGQRTLLSPSASMALGARANLQSMVGDLLQSMNRKHSDICAIGVNIGPGGLSSTRAGVSFANALAFALSIPVFAFSYFDIVSEQIGSHFTIPILCVIPAAAGNAYVVLLDGSSRRSAFGPFGATVKKIVNGYDRLAVAGRLRDRLPVLPGKQFVDSGIGAPDPAVLLEMAVRADQLGGNRTRQAIPLNEEAPEFRE
jgi:tRNA threonylcarbamoyladenosine biosynthesis protein TsaB